MNYDTISVLFRIMLMLGLFLILCGSIYMLSLVFRRKSISLIIPTLCTLVLSAGMMLLYTADVRSEKRNWLLRLSAVGFVNCPLSISSSLWL